MFKKFEKDMEKNTPHGPLLERLIPSTDRGDPY